MATETLRLDIVANNKDAVAALKQTDSELKKVASSALQTGSNVAKGSNQAANALTNLGRVAQDAPFGFIGIQNNLNPLLESFQRLKVETGSTGSALKSLASSMIGPAGLGLALSVASGLILAFGDKLMGASAATKTLDAQQKALTDTLSKNLGQAKAEVTTMGILSGIVNDVTKSTAERARALKQLKDEYPGYEALQKVDITDTAQLAKVTDVLTAAIMRKARVEAYSALIAAEEAKQVKIALENDKQRADRLGFLTKAIKDYAVPLLKLVDPTNANIAATKTQIASLEAAGKEYDANAKFINTLKASLAAVTGEQIKNNDATILSTDAKKKEKKSVDELKNAVAEYIKQEQYLRILQKQGMRDISTRAVRSAEVEAPQATGNDAMVQRTQAVISATQAQLTYANSLKVTAMEEEKIAMWAGIANDAFSAFQSSLAAGSSVVDSLGDAFKRLAIQIAISLAKTAALAGLISLFSGGKIDFGSAFKLASKFTGGLPFAREGGVFSGPSSGYPAILHGTEAVLNPKQFKNLTSNMMNIGAMRGMGQSQSSNGQVVLRGQDLVLALDRAGVNLNLRRG